MQKGHEIKVLNAGYVRLVDWMGDDLSPVSAARMSTGNPTGIDEAKDDGTRDYLWRHAHATPFEMAVLQVEIQCPIFVARQIQRHRTFSFNEFSGRYAEMPDLFYVPDPERICSQDGHNKQGSGKALDEVAASYVRNRMEDEQETVSGGYRRNLEEGVSRELARMNLPLSQYTRMRMQANLRNWLHFLKLRLDPHAQYEIRVYAEAVASIIEALWPKTWETFREHTLEAVTFSRTEMMLIRGLAMERGFTGEGVEALLGGIESLLGKSRAREFLAKLGLQEKSPAV